MKVEPIKDRVLIKQAESTKQVSNFSIVSGKEKKPARGIVVAIGKDVEQCQIGDDIDYNEFSATEHEIEGEKYMLVRELDIQLIR